MPVIRTAEVTVPASEVVSLICRIGRRRCALPIDKVVEVARVLPTDAVADAPVFVAGLSVIRGTPTPVVDAGRLVGEPGTVATRFIVLSVGARQVALSVEACEGVRRIDAAILGALPPLLQDAPGEVVSAVGVLDGGLVETLDTARLVPPEVFAALDAPAEGA